jgi:diguanylate cyclase (GGDEF)-like protein
VAAARRAACTDVLTGLANRAGLVDRGPRVFAAAAAAGVPVGVVLVDLVGFKGVNDTWGHAAGDAVLIEVGARLAALPGVAGGAGLAVRLGGDEFAVLVTGPTDAAEGWLSAWLEAAHEAVTRPVEVEGSLVRVGATFGAVTARPGESLSVVLGRADAAMYAARAAGSAVRVEAGSGPVRVPQPRPAVRRRDQVRTSPAGEVVPSARVVGGGW